MLTYFSQWRANMVHGLLIVALSALALNTLPAHGQTMAADSEAVATTVGAFHAALARGDGEAAMRLLAPDAVILESGGRESRDEYRNHHLAGDIQFAQAVPSQHGTPQVSVNGDLAWLSSTSITQGVFRGKAVNSAGAELVVLSRAGSGWIIRAIHWSSQSRRSAG